jgi:nicotinate-nucleotide pyrophosphorylase (carboxylating)
VIPAPLDPAEIERVAAAALAEDLGERGDVTSEAVVERGSVARGRLTARQHLVVAGVPVAREVYRLLDPALRFEACREEGELVPPGTVVAEVVGDARSILRGERCALNFLMRMCGIATAARAAVEEVSGTGAAILDTRKTAPGLRHLDKYAVRSGGATNHRMGLHDAVLIKDTHLAAVGSIGVAVARALAQGHPPERITVEVGSRAQLDQAVAAGAGRVLLDNMDPATLRECVARAAGRVVLEASGGLRPGTLRAAAETGVDCLSVGWLTHSAPAADLALDVEPA